MSVSRLSIVIVVVTCVLSASSFSVGALSADTQNAGSRPSSAQLPDHPSPGSQPKYCKNLDCPIPTIERYADIYQVKRFEKLRWAVANVSEAESFEHAVLKGWRLIEEYRNGGNEQKVKLPMTVPLLTVVSPHPNNTYFFVAAMIPYEWQDKAPKPNSKDIMLLKSKAFRVYSRTFGGYAVSRKLYEVAGQHHAAILRDKLKHNDWIHAVAVFDSPFQFKDRHNEIWLFEKVRAHGHRTDEDDDGATTQAVDESLRCLSPVFDVEELHANTTAPATTPPQVHAPQATPISRARAHSPHRYRPMHARLKAHHVEVVKDLNGDPVILRDEEAQ